MSNIERRTSNVECGTPAGRDAVCFLDTVPARRDFAALRINGKRKWPGVISQLQITMQDQYVSPALTLLLSKCGGNLKIPDPLTQHQYKISNRHLIH